MTPDEKWEECKRALQAYQQEQFAAWGDVDETTVARYLAGECTNEEREDVEREMASHPRLRESIAFIKGVMDGQDYNPLQ
jgi:ADP-heptose:LPS heptosyltransferase